MNEREKESKEISGAKKEYFHVCFEIENIRGKWKLMKKAGFTRIRTDCFRMERNSEKRKPVGDGLYWTDAALDNDKNPDIIGKKIRVYF